jgi:hypothetical protein
MTEFTGQCMDPGKDLVPATPELWWSPILGVIINSGAGGYWNLLDNKTWPLPAPEYHQDESLPADAVKLGSVDALRAELVETDREWRKAYDELRHRERKQAVQLNELRRKQHQQADRLNGVREMLDRSAHWAPPTYPAAGIAQTIASICDALEES